MLKVRQAALAILLSGFIAFASCANASIIDFEFDATLQSGALAGTEFMGTGSYDTQGSTGVGMEYLFLTSLNFTLLGESFTRNDISQGGQVILENGLFSYFTAAFFPQVPGPVDDIAFGFGGPGIIGYSTPPGFNAGEGIYVVQSVIQTVVPEPSTLGLCGMALLLSGSLFGELRKVRRLAPQA